MIWFVSRAVYGAIGGIGGSVASSATSSAGHAAASQHTSGNINKVKVTEVRKQKAVVEALKTVQSMFEYDDAAKIWKSKVPQS